ncbi:hypothetical protein DFH06DRAFT_607750 [Mycena polygramma]|nr:hypothetical protein DFH06DRAFT_607750 [Mycena polygramma]
MRPRLSPWMQLGCALATLGQLAARLRLPLTIVRSRVVDAQQLAYSCVSTLGARDNSRASKAKVCAQRCQRRCKLLTFDSLGLVPLVYKSHFGYRTLVPRSTGGLLILEEKTCFT